MRAARRENTADRYKNWDKKEQREKLEHSKEAKEGAEGCVILIPGVSELARKCANEL